MTRLGIVAAASVAGWFTYQRLRVALTRTIEDFLADVSDGRGWR